MILIKLFGKEDGNQSSFLVKVSLSLIFSLPAIFCCWQKLLSLKSNWSRMCLIPFAWVLEKVAITKTLTFFSQNVHAVDVKKDWRQARITAIKNFRIYLGMPLLHKWITNQTYKNIIGHVQLRLSGWTAKHLSLTGRITLMQSVIHALSIYSMQTIMLSTSI